LNVIRGYPKLIITPNVNEFERIKLALNIHIKDRKESVLKSSDLLGCVIFSKGQTDLIASRGVVVEVDQDGSPRRCGGQGDILTGCIATFLAWGLKNDVDMDLYLNACYAGSVLVRRASKEAFAVHYRSMIASDIIRFISKAFNEKFETE
jgi:ATP-dependent NAD(P)H-hydrate dehydratase